MPLRANPSSLCNRCKRSKAALGRPFTLTLRSESIRRMDMISTRSCTPRRPHTHVAPKLDKGLLGYAVAASAASVGVLALAQPAAAKVIYTQVNVPITWNRVPVPFDINNDGITDFSFFASSGPRAEGFDGLEGTNGADLLIIPAQPANEVAVVNDCAAELPAGIKVGPARNFQYGSQRMWSAWGNSIGGGTGCPWVRNSGGFLGLKFKVNGDTHYAWARVSLVNGDTLIGYAYETETNKPIMTGRPIPPGDAEGSEHDGTVPGASVPYSPALQAGTLGVLARGASIP